MDIRGVWVHFQIRDVFVPEPPALLDLLHGSDVLQGRVVAISDTGEPNGRYAVVEVEGIEQPLIVSANSLRISHTIE